MFERGCLIKSAKKLISCPAINRQRCLLSPQAAQIIDVAARLAVDTRKWIASKVLPKKYGDRQVLAGDPDAPLQVTKIELVAVSPSAPEPGRETRG